MTHVQSAVQGEKLLVFSVFYCKMLLIYFKNAKFSDFKHLSSSFHGSQLLQIILIKGYLVVHMSNSSHCHNSTFMEFYGIFSFIN